jgi:hypothetical protein
LILGFLNENLIQVTIFYKYNLMYHTYRKNVDLYATI